MPRFAKRISKKKGLAPGTLVYIGEKGAEHIRITLIDYDEKTFQEKEVKTIEECLPFRDKPTVTWINIDGLHDTGVIEEIGTHFNLHPLVLEDILNTGQRAKMEDLDRYIFVVLKMVCYDQKEDLMITEQVSIIVGSNYVI